MIHTSALQLDYLTDKITVIKINRAIFTVMEQPSATAFKSLQVESYRGLTLNSTTPRNNPCHCLILYKMSDVDVKTALKHQLDI